MKTRKLTFTIKARRSWRKGLTEWYGWDLAKCNKAFAWLERNHTAEALSVALCSISHAVEYLTRNEYQWNR